MPATRQQVAEAVEWVSSIPQGEHQWAEALLMAAIDETVGDFGRAVRLAKVEYGRGVAPGPRAQRTPPPQEDDEPQPAGNPWLDEGPPDGDGESTRNSNPEGCNQYTGPGCSTGGGAAHRSEHHAEAVANLDASLSASGIPEARKAEYHAASVAVINAMPPAAVERYNRYCRSHVFHPTLEAMTANLVAETPALRSQIPVGGVAGGSYHPGKLRIDVDGGGLPLGGREVGAQGLHAHEFMHAVDGPFRAVSGHQEWQKAWREELSQNQLTKYAASNPHEGLAELGRAMWGGDHERSDIEKAFPKCVRFLKRSSLW